MFTKTMTAAVALAAASFLAVAPASADPLAVDGGWHEFSFGGQGSAFSPIYEFTLSTYAELLRLSNFDVILRSVVMAIAVTIASIIIAFPFAYFAARYARGKWKAVFYLLVLLPHIQAGKLRPLAVTDPTRSGVLPEVPTLAEAGVTGVAVTSWYGVMAPKGTPAPVLAQLASDITQIFSAPATKAQLEKQGLNVWINTGSVFGDLIRKEAAMWAPIIKSRKIEAD